MEKSAKRQRRIRRGSATFFSLGFLIVVGLVVGGGFWYLRRSSSKPAELILTDVVKRGPFEHVVLEQGEIESSKNVEVLCEVESRNSAGTAILWVIDEGTKVERGDKLVELDASALEQELKQQRVVVNAALAAKISADSTLEQAQVAKSEYVEGTFAQEEKVILSEILVAEEKLSRAGETSKFSERLAALGFQTTLQLKADQFAVEQAQVELELAQNKLKTLRDITRKKMLIQLNADIEKAQAQVQATTSSLQEEQIKLQDIEEQIKKCVIYAPEAGVAIHANRSSNRGSAEFVLEPGALVRERQPLVRLPDSTKMQIKANINEARIPLVKEGMDVAIKVGAFEDQVLHGKVTKVNKYAEPTSWFSSQVKEYATFIEIHDPPPEIRTGMTAEVRIFVAQLPSELQIPAQALYEFKGRLFCLVKQGAQFETREVTIGASNDKTVVVQSGLEEGDVLVLNPRTHRSKMDLPDLPDLPAEKPPQAAETVAGTTSAADNSGADSGATDDTRGTRATNSQQPNVGGG